MNGIPFIPPQASSVARQIDRLFLFELGVAGFFVLLIFLLIVTFTLRYFRRSENEIPPKQPPHFGLEMLWTIIPFILMMIMYFWGANLYVKLKRPIDNALEIHVIGKQWMWKIEQPGGVREINELHVPLGQPVKLIMASEDVIHDFFIPAFRVKQDLVPGSYVTEWFIATEPGEYHLFCAQYCGTNHAQMVGRVVVMQPSDYQAWLAGAIPSESPAAAGAKLFTSYGCIACHGQRAPTMAGLFMSRVQLQDGSIVVADENYLRAAILNPGDHIVAGYPMIMPSFRGQLSEEQLFQIIAYIKSLETVRNVTQPPPPAAPLIAPSTRPAQGDQPSVVPNYPPVEQPAPIEPSPGRQ